MVVKVPSDRSFTTKWPARGPQPALFSSSASFTVTTWPVYTHDDLVDELAGHVSVLTDCRKGAVRVALALSRSVNRPTAHGHGNR